MPATLPCPKIPKTPPKNGCSRPSREERCCDRNRTTACAMVRRSILAGLIAGPTPESTQGTLRTRRPDKPRIAQVSQRRYSPLRHEGRDLVERRHEVGAAVARDDDRAAGIPHAGGSLERPALKVAVQKTA